jgi:uncharacterized protein
MSRVRCPVCGRLFDDQPGATMPFCSERCRTVDLDRWLSETYGLPQPPEETPEAAELPQKPDDPPPRPDS